MAAWPAWGRGGGGDGRIGALLGLAMRLPRPGRTAALLLLIIPAAGPVGRTLSGCLSWPALSPAPLRPRMPSLLLDLSLLASSQMSPSLSSPSNLASRFDVPRDRVPEYRMIHLLHQRPLRLRCCLPPPPAAPSDETDAAS